MKRPNLLELKKKYIPLRAAGKITKRDGIFSYCEHDFKIDGISWGGEKINLSISYRNGFRVFWHNSWRRARLQDGLQRTYGDTMSNTEYELLAKTLEADMHTNCVCV